MAFFQFRRKIDVAKDYSLEEIPVFSSLTPAELNLIEKKARMTEFKRGDIVYEQATPAEAFYVVISGRFHLFTKARPNAPEETLTHFYRGEHFGETSLLTGKPHSGTVVATKDSVILKLMKDDFLKLVKDIPSISLHLSRSLGHRLTKNHDDSGRRQVRITSLYSRSQGESSLEFWFDFAASINHQTNSPVILLDFCLHKGAQVQESLKNENIPIFDFASMEPSKEEDLKKSIVTHPKNFDYLYAPASDMELEESNERKIGTLLTFLTYQYNYILLRLPSDIGHVAFQVMKRSDYVYLYCKPDALEIGESAEAITEFQKAFGFSQSEIRILTEERRDEGFIGYEEQEEMLGMPIFSLVPSKTEQPQRYRGVLKYVSKELCGTLVGLVLGSGAAYGMAHVGVLKVLEEEGVEIDVVAGSSIGALLGALWAAGYNAKQIENIANSIDKKNGFFKLVGFSDLSLAHRGFIKGNQIQKFLRSFLGNRNFQELKIPLKIAAADLFTSEEVVFDTGDVVKAIRASISIPGIFRPFPHQGKYLIDGGVIDPLPVRVLAKSGIKKIIAVNVLASPKDRAERNIVRRDHQRRKKSDIKKKNFLTRFFSNFTHRVKDRYAVNIFNVIMSTVQFMEYEIADSWADQADILIHAVAQEGHWAEFYSAKKFIEVGEKRTREQIEDIKALVSE